MKISIASDVKALSKRLSALQQKQIPFATAQAVNDLAFQVMRAERAAMSKTFHHASAFTQSGIQVKQKATKAKPTATVWVEPKRARYLNSYEFGGLAAASPSKHSTGSTLLAVKGVRLGPNGQIPKGMIARLLARPDCFKGKIHGVHGIWQRLPRPVPTAGRRRQLQANIQRMQVRLLIRFADPLPVKKHLGFRERATALVKAQSPAALRNALAKAMRTAK